ncbi:MAG: CopG family transcriptional regulator [bacterium]|nr:CopG family transcriptional regulator [bacterium]
MKRTQIYLSNEQWRNLNIAKEKRHLSIAELIRQAIDKVYVKKHQSKFEESLDAITGLWKDRTDLPSTDEYIRTLRKDNRIERF